MTKNGFCPSVVCIYPGLVPHLSCACLAVVYCLSSVDFPRIGMNDKFQSILSSLPEKSPRSRLAPYYELIEELRSRGCTYREIERILVGQCQFQISRSAINNFMRAQSRKKVKPSKRPSVAPMDRNAVGQAVIADLNPKTDAATQNCQPMDEVFQRIAALKKQPTTTSSSSKLFQYDPNEPLRIERNPGKENPGE